MPILTKSGRVVIAESIALRSIHLAWGAGDSAWLSPPAEDPDQDALQNEVGRRVAEDVTYVVPDPDGTIVLPTGKFTVSATPTNYLYMQFRFEFLEEQSTVIREIGVFAGTEVQAELPPTQEYFTPSEVTSTGRMLHLENLAPIYRSPAIRESFNIVIAF